MRHLVTISGKLKEDGRVATLNIPNLSEEAALRLYVKDGEAEVVITMIADPAIVSTHARYFALIATEAVPANFVKYIGSYPRPSDGDLLHVIEISTSLSPLQSGS